MEVLKNNEYVKHLVTHHEIPLQDLIDVIRVAPDHFFIYSYISYFPCTKTAEIELSKMVIQVRSLLGLEELPIDKKSV